ncbi:MAG: PAS domain-containing sensor histidine kinase [Bacteroidota bacterium]|nr:PAS domain-containing sensor histidine kinase [Bacteroidota bacterium]
MIRVDLKPDLEKSLPKLGHSEFEFLFHHSLAGYWDWDVVSGETYMSPSFKAMFGYQPEELENHINTVFSLLLEEDHACANEAIGAHMESQGKIPYQEVLRFRHKDGSTVYVNCNGRIVSWSDEGKPLRMIGTHADITESKTNEQRAQMQARRSQTLFEELRKQKSKNVALEQFTAIASHDLKEPLRTMGSYASLLLSNADEANSTMSQERRLQSLEFIASASKRMTAMIDTLLDYSKIGKGSQKSEVNLNEIVQHVTHDLANQIQQAKAQVTCKELPTIQGYGVELGQLFQNLINNAIKYTDPSVPPIIEISCTTDENSVYQTFDVKDNGLGIPEDKIENVFELYSRAHIDHGFEGQGIGLARCKKIVELHDGKIEALPNPTGGSIFRFTILST